MGRVGLRRLSAIAWVCLFASVGFASPAAAHGGVPHFATAITSIEPSVPGAHITAALDGSYLSITNPTRRTIVVLGYDHDQYLRITADGVARNVHSPTAFRNDGSLTETLPAALNAHGTAEWHQISTSNTWRFRDDRIRWTGSSRPAVVDQSPNAFHLIRRWQIELLVDDTPVTISGTLSWHPGSSKSALVAFAAVCSILLLGVVVLLVLDERRRHRRGV